jgi:Domain of unknown function (DUF2019)
MTHLLKHMSPQSLVELFATESTAREIVLEAGDPRGANKHFDKMVAAYRELRSRGAEALTLLLPLLDHEDPRVRADAARYALEFAPHLAERVLTSMEDLRGNVGASVYLILDKWRKGTLNFPP